MSTATLFLDKLAIKLKQGGTGGRGPWSMIAFRSATVIGATLFLGQSAWFGGQVFADPPIGGQPSTAKGPGPSAGLPFAQHPASG